jgi:hypothetical protein
MQPRCSARGGVRGVRSGAGCGVAKHGADEPAKRSSSVSGAWRTGPPPIHSPQAATGRHRMTRPRQDEAPRGELLADSGPGPGANASPLIKELAA